MADCLFCGVASGEVPSRKVAEDDTLVAFEDIHPGAPVHVLIIPRRHLTDIREAEDGQLLEAMFLLANKIASDRGIEQSGYRLVFNVGPDSGQSVFHLHLHLLGGRRMGWPPG